MKHRIKNKLKYQARLSGMCKTKVFKDKKKEAKKTNKYKGDRND